MKKKPSQLSLNRETLLRLQEQQMKALAGGVENMSNGTSSAPGSCTSTEQCTVATGSGCNDTETKPAASAAEEGNTSCCKKSCNP